ncbi:MAG: universal stress protein [Gammaproteobacteria bacterium]|nr:universal stress protein [Gammaproteobacteria bacterium]
MALRRGLAPVVVTVGESERKVEQVLTAAVGYLERLGVRATGVHERGPVDEAIERSCRHHDCDVVFLGSHRYARWLEEVMGGVLEKVMQRLDVPLVVT